jgi:hypothetical protein
MLRLPPRYLRTLLLRGAALWLLARLMGKAAFAAAAAEDGGVLIPIWVLVMAVSLTFVDLLRRKELSLLHNLGVTTGGAVLAGSLPAAVMETLLMLAK